MADDPTRRKKPKLKAEEPAATASFEGMQRTKPATHAAHSASASASASAPASSQSSSQSTARESNSSQDSNMSVAGSQNNAAAASASAATNQRAARSRSAASAAASSSCAPSPSSLAEFALPDVQRLIDDAPEKAKIESGRGSNSAGASAGSKRKGSSSRWLLMCAACVLEEVTCGKDKHKMLVQGMTACFRVLLDYLDAAPDAVDSAGHSAVHWLVFMSTADFSEEEIKFKPADERLQAGLETACMKPGDDESAEPWLWSLFRYRCEPALQVLLKGSKSFGYIGNIADIVAWNSSEEGQASQIASSNSKHKKLKFKRNPSLLDLQDINGNTALHWAAAHRNCSMVGLLLFHGASVDIRNNAGQRPFDLVEFDDADQTMHDEELNGAYNADSFTSMLRPQIYSSVTHTYERKWGLADGLRIEQCSYLGESDSAAIKRLLFQRELYRATDAGESGDAIQVRRLVSLWKAAESKGKRMYPLTYRADTDEYSPIQVAVEMVDQRAGVELLQMILDLPNNLHVQSSRMEWECGSLAAINSNIDALDLLIRAGYNINARDCSSGKTALMALAQALPMELCPDEQLAQELNAPDGASMFLRQPYTAQLTRELLKRGADPMVVDNGGSTPLHYSAHKGQAALVSLYLQWAAATQKDQTLDSLASSPFVSRVNSYGSNALHYAFYCAHQTPTHVDCVRSLLSVGLSLDSPRNNLGRTPLQMFAAPQSDSGIDVCSLVLKQSVRRVLDQVNPPKKAVKFKILSSDLSDGKEPKYSIEVATELEPTAAELASLEAFKYSMANTLSVRSHESSIPMLNSDVTLCETVGRTRAGSDLSRSKRVQAKPSFEAEESDAENEDDDPADLRRRLNGGMAFPLCIRLTAKKGWGVFAKKDIPRDSFLFEYIGVLLSAAEGERRALQYMSEGRHHYSFTAVLMNLDGDVYSLDATTQGNIARFCNHSCDPNVGVYRVLDRTRIACFSLRHIKAGEELTIDYNFEKSYVTGPAFICECGAKECQRRMHSRGSNAAQPTTATHIASCRVCPFRRARAHLTLKQKRSTLSNHPLCSRVPIASPALACSAARAAASHRAASSFIISCIAQRATLNALFISASPSFRACRLVSIECCCCCSFALRPLCSALLCCARR